MRRRLALSDILRRERREQRRRARIAAREKKHEMKKHGYKIAETDENYDTIRIPTGLRSISEGMFSYCINLRKIELPSTLLYIEKYAFRGCSSLKKLRIPDGTLTIGECAFEDCRLEDVYIPASVTKIEPGAFHNATRFTVHTPKGSYAAQFAKKNSLPISYTNVNPKWRLRRFALRLRKRFRK